MAGKLIFNLLVLNLLFEGFWGQLTTNLVLDFQNTKWWIKNEIIRIRLKQN